MDKEWSQLNKMMQVQIWKKETFAMMMETLLHLREELRKQILEFPNTLSKEELCAISFINAKGYHSK